MFFSAQKYVCISLTSFFSPPHDDEYADRATACAVDRQLDV
jgi:hypothetical protein